MPSPSYFPTARIWIQKTTTPNGNRIIEARGLDALLKQYENIPAHDVAGRYTLIDQLLKRCNKGLEQAHENPYLASQFFALQVGLLSEVSKITREKQAHKWQTVKPQNPGARARLPQLGAHRENVGLSDAYALEGADPKHRFGMFWRMAQSMAPDSATTQQALMAWANQEESAIWNSLRQSAGFRESYVKYLAEGERWRYMLTTRGGILYRNSDLGKEIPFSTKYAKVSDSFSGRSLNRGRAIWVMSTEGKWYSGLHDTGKFHHSSFLSGAMIICGGEVIASQGKLIYLSNKTGHYKAGPKNLFNALRHMDSSIDFDGVILNLFVGQNQEFWTPAQQFLNNDGRLPGCRGFQFDLTQKSVRDNRIALIDSISDWVFRGNASPPDIFNLNTSSQPAGQPTTQADAGEYVEASNVPEFTNYVPADKVTGEMN